MNIFYKITTYIFIALILSYFVYIGNGNFFNDFTKNIIPLLATLLAINITTSALIFGELNKLKTKYQNADSRKINKEIKNTFIIQISLLFILFVLLIIKDILTNEDKEINKYYHILSNTVIIGTFLYYLEVIYDLGIALLSIINFNKEN